MEKISTYGELLYIGFNAEKGRCKSQGFWNIGYKSTLKEHLVFLKRIAIRIRVKSIEEDDTTLLTDFFKMCSNSKNIGKVYGFSSDVGNITKSNISVMLSSISEAHFNDTVGNLILIMIDDLLVTLDRKPLDKKKVHMLLRALHNLPRCFLNEHAKTLCCLKQPRISCEDAIKYAFDNMDIESKQRYMKIISEEEFYE